MQRCASAQCYVIACSTRNLGPYVTMKPEATYSLEIQNRQMFPCVARLEINGVLIGTWDIPEHGCRLVHRPIGDSRRFVFKGATTTLCITTTRRSHDSRIDNSTKICQVLYLVKLLPIEIVSRLDRAIWYHCTNGTNDDVSNDDVSFLRGACEVKDIPPCETVITTTGEILYIDKIHEHSTLRIRFPNITRIVHKRKDLTRDQEIPHLTKNTICKQSDWKCETNTTRLYREAVYKHRKFYYIPALLCPCQDKIGCGKTCQKENLYLVAENVHIGTRCALTGSSPIAGYRYIHRKHPGLSICAKAFETLLSEEEKQEFLVLQREYS